ncbi:DUF4230 domain-containing protein [Planococcus sp. CP5-4]|uniref:DUF4230 domain-containing protein n=1 Tax=unclassified Planococcus (in: firmicutes) TaxID=2662419 RepID=UPI001C224F6D|nr:MULTISPECIES: DUF4230 domain-containing protein [unclassified Planococcus (in: firmicutes)]MBU9674219.1 DUF4230 domain-containing protein [Planococcus sp. CP5-4_YE]MBV0909309.1 DUF4230 domain-containing protein [Planococcus sp. CP5-4_UN]MBW6063801.1 DUF4230 domain-containing protein [Planococcus sp. CP5-4]
MKKLVVILFFVLIIGAAAGYAFSQTNLFGVATNSSSDASLVKDQIVKIAELASLEYEYSNVIVSETGKNISLPGVSDIKFAEAIRLIEYDGYIKAGSKASEIETSYDESTKQLVVRVPKAEILENVADTENMEIRDIKDELFSDYPSQKIIEDINTEKEKLEKEKIEQGFLEEADNNTEEILTALLETPAYEEVIIEFY